MKLITNKFKSGGLHEKHVVATWNLGNHLSIYLVLHFPSFLVNGVSMKSSGTAEVSVRRDVARRY